MLIALNVTLLHPCRGKEPDAADFDTYAEELFKISERHPVLVVGATWHEGRVILDFEDLRLQALAGTTGKAGKRPRLTMIIAAVARHLTEAFT